MLLLDDLKQWLKRNGWKRHGENRYVKKDHVMTISITVALHQGGFLKGSQPIESLRINSKDKLLGMKK